jgi:1-acyl-sn-glycerol-3-phosphate acyltransferase
LWLASGFGLRIRSRRFQALHYQLLEWYVGGIARGARTVLDIDVVTRPSEEAARALEADRPLLFFSRHAGPGETILLIDLLITHYHRHPSVVFRDALAIDPSIDLLGHRQPHAILDTSDPGECEAQIQQVAAGLDPRGILVLFPEGGNFTRERRRGALRKLWPGARLRGAARG